jgi:hypothetical protein
MFGSLDVTGKEIFLLSDASHDLTWQDTVIGDGFPFLTESSF